MFSGLGSGVGSTPQPMQSHNSPTPVRQSGPGDDDEAEAAPTLATIPRRGKRARDHEARYDSDEGRQTPGSIAMPGPKRNQVSHSGHHHHHHAHGHQ